MEFLPRLFIKNDFFLNVFPTENEKCKTIF